MKEIVVYTRSGTVSPSSNYRILQYVPFLKGDIVTRPLSSEFLYKHHANATTKVQKLFWYSLYYLVIQFNITRFMIADIMERPDYIIVQRAISPKFVLFWNKFLIKKVFNSCNNLIWDFDDEIFNSREITQFESELLKTASKTIIVTSDFLKTRMENKFQSKVILMPTTDAEFANENFEEMLCLRKTVYEKQIELLWLATSPSLPHLHKIEKVLDEAAKELEEKYSKKLILHVVCNRPLNFNPQCLILDNVVWSRDKAREMIRRSHIGIMPLTNTVSSKGKGGFKIVQYMSAGMPAVVSAFGFNNEVVLDGKTGFLIDDEDDMKGWITAILKLSSNWDLYCKFCKESKMHWENDFSFEKNVNVWNDKILV